MGKVIPIQVKKVCCQMRAEGKSYREIYNEYFTSNVDHEVSYDSFRRLVLRWMNKHYPDDTTLECGTYEGFTAHNATVQVSARKSH